MKKTRVEILLIGLTVLALSAGVVAGLVAARLPAQSSPDALPPMPPGPTDRSLAEELNLTPDQRSKMRDIWEGVRAKVHATFDNAQDLQRQRDNAIAAILDDAQKAKFEQISKDFAGKYTDLSRQRDKTFDSAVEQTKKLLNETQRGKYEEILKTHVRPGGPPFGAPPSGGTTKPAT